jgi:hypothetical protein
MDSSVEIKLGVLLCCTGRVSPIPAAADPGTVPMQGFGTLLGFEATDVDIDFDHDNAPIRLSK